MMIPLSVKIHNISSNPNPKYATDGASGLDLRAFLKENMEIPPQQRKIVPTGLFIEIPEGFEAQIRPRSGLALKQGITLFNDPGTIDSDYRGEIKVLLLNLSQVTFTIENGNRIAQIIFFQYEKIKWKDLL